MQNLDQFSNMQPKHPIKIDRNETNISQQPTVDMTLNNQRPDEFVSKQESKICPDNEALKSWSNSSEISDEDEKKLLKAYNPDFLN